MTGGGYIMGDRVRRPGKSVAYPGESETTVIAVYKVSMWNCGKEPPEVYMLADGDLRTAEQLEPAPKRTPKIGEVWNLHGYVCHILTEGRVCGLENGTLYYPETDHAALQAQGQFLADSPVAYYRSLP